MAQAQARQAAANAAAAQGQQAPVQPPVVVPLKAAQLGALPRFPHGADATEFQPKLRARTLALGIVEAQAMGSSSNLSKGLSSAPPKVINLVDQKAGESLQA